ncbi:hypothetical protein [Timonella sp. A28]|uniref:hypothetical protein n=1 Tax=Timonella sp. A28 TaxID=3442640 RepID=UPI003EB89E6A
MFTRSLVIADYRADCIYAVQGTQVTLINSGVLAEHAGIIGLPHHMGSATPWAYVDDKRGTLVLHTDNKTEPTHIPVAIPSEHIASDPTGQYIAATSGLGANFEPWSDIVTIADTKSGESVRFRTRVGEPGVVITTDRTTREPILVLRHREPGAIEAIPLAEALAVGPHVPVLTGKTTTDIADDGHGDVVDQETGIVATATSRGLERFIVENGQPRALPTIAWPVPGRAFYLRFDPNTHSALGIVRGGPANPQAWTDWTNHLVEIDLNTGETRHVALPNGLAFRFAFGGNRVAVASIHPDGDQLTLLQRDTTTLAVTQRIPLPSMSNPPTPGHLPWDPVGDSPAQRRAVAVDPTGETVAVTRGGDSQIHLITQRGMDTLTLPTPLHEGGVLFWTGGPNDPVGR